MFEELFPTQVGMIRRINSIAIVKKAFPYAGGDDPPS